MVERSGDNYTKTNKADKIVETKTKTEFNPTIKVNNDSEIMLPCQKIQTI